MTVSLITDELGTALDKDFRQALISNFKAIELELNNIHTNITSLQTTDQTASPTVTQDDLTKAVNNLTSRINRIILGIDSDSIELVVTQILEEKGVIKDADTNV